MVKAVDGKELPAVTVFSKALQYIKDITLQYMNKQVPIPRRSILWIITVPAIWSPAAKQIMRTAAENVRIILISIIRAFGSSCSQLNIHMYVCSYVCHSVNCYQVYYQQIISLIQQIMHNIV